MEITHKIKIIEVNLDKYRAQSVIYVIYTTTISVFNVNYVIYRNNLHENKLTKCIDLPIYLQIFCKIIKLKEYIFYFKF